VQFSCKYFSRHTFENENEEIDSVRACSDMVDAAVDETCIRWASDYSACYCRLLHRGINLQATKAAWNRFSFLTACSWPVKSAR